MNIEWQSDKAKLTQVGSLSPACMPKLTLHKAPPFFFIGKQKNRYNSRNKTESGISFLLFDEKHS